MKKILIFADKISLSGASKIIAWIVNRLSQNKINVTLITYLPIKDQRSIDPKVERIILDIPRNNRFSRGVLIIKKLRNIIKKEKFDLCIGFLPTECLYLQIATIFLKNKILVCERSDPYFERSCMANIGRFFYRFANGAVFQTSEAKDYFPVSLKEKSVVIPNPAFSSKKPIIPYSNRENIIVTSGRLYIKQKRQDILLNAFSKVCEWDENVILKIYGDGPDREKLVRLSKELDIFNRVIFEGNVNNVESLIGNSKVFVLTSDYEGIPNAIIEAMQQGVPVVTTDCSPGGARALIENGIDGSIVPIRDIDGIAMKVKSILSDQSIAETYIKNGLKIKERCSEDKIFSMWLQYLDTFSGVVDDDKF